LKKVTRGKTLSLRKNSCSCVGSFNAPIEIISEAKPRNSQRFDRNETRNSLARVQGIGNVYGMNKRGLSDRIIWNVVVDELPRLKLAVAAIAAIVKEISRGLVRPVQNSRRAITFA